MEARAIKRYIGSSPRKMRLVVDLIRKKSVKQGLSILKFSKKHPAKEVEKTLKSAYSNLVNAADTGKIDMDEVFVKEAFVDGGPSTKRMLPAPQGRAYRIRKRSAHLTIIVENIEGAEKPKKEKVVKTTEKIKKQPKVKEAEVAEVEEVMQEETAEEKKTAPKKRTKTAVKKETPAKETASKKKTSKPPAKKKAKESDEDKPEKKTAKKTTTIKKTNKKDKK